MDDATFRDAIARLREAAVEAGAQDLVDRVDALEREVDKRRVGALTALHRPHTMHWDVTPDGDILCTEGSLADAVAYWAALRGGQWAVLYYTECLTYDGRTHVTVQQLDIANPPERP